MRLLIPQSRIMITDIAALQLCAKTGLVHRSKKHQRRSSMDHFLGLNVAVAENSICLWIKKTVECRGNRSSPSTETPFVTLTSIEVILRSRKGVPPPIAR